MAVLNKETGPLSFGPLMKRSILLSLIILITLILFSTFRSIQPAIAPVEATSTTNTVEVTTPAEKPHQEPKIGSDEWLAGWAKLSVAEKVKLNPYKCDTVKQIIREDNGECKLKLSAKSSSAQSAATHQSGSTTTVIVGTKLDWLKASNIKSSDWQYVDWIIQRESSWNPQAVNYLGCIGLGQSCPGGSGLKNDCPDWRTNPVCQLNHFNGYAARYGGWYGSYLAWQRQGWW